jgi:hypothetical protein
MKKLSNTLFTQMSLEQLEILTTVVKETLATGLVQPKRKIFSAADLWNIQRQGKTRIQRRTFA